MTMDWIMFSQVFVGLGGGVGISGPMSSGRGGLGVDMSSGVVLSRGRHV